MKLEIWELLDKLNSPLFLEKIKSHKTWYCGKYQVFSTDFLLLRIIDEAYLCDAKNEILIFGSPRSEGLYIESRKCFSFDEFLTADISDSAFDEITLDFGQMGIHWNKSISLLDHPLKRIGR